MKNITLFFLLFLFLFGDSQAQPPVTNDFVLSVSAGNFVVGKRYIKGLWVGIDGAKAIVKKQKGCLRRLDVGAELYFENGADRATIFNPSAQQFIGERAFHESNNGLTAKLSWYPFLGFLKGLHLSAGPLLVYSIRTYENRWQSIQYSPTLAVRMSEMGFDARLLFGYRLVAGYEVYFAKRFLVGARADFLQYHQRDLNSLWAIKAGYRF